MEYVRDTDKTHKGYKHYIDIQDHTSRGDIKEYVSRLSAQQKADLLKYKGLLRQRKFQKKKDDKTTYNAIRHEYITNKRATESEIIKSKTDGIIRSIGHGIKQRKKK